MTVIYLALPVCMVFMSQTQSAHYTGRRGGGNRWEVYSNEKRQSEFLVFWRKLGFRYCAENKHLKTMSVSGAVSLPFQFNDSVKICNNGIMLQMSMNHFNESLYNQ